MILQKSNSEKEIENCFLENINEIDKFQARLVREKRERKHKLLNLLIRNEMDDITTKSTDIKRIIRDYYKPLYTSEFDNLDEMDKLKDTAIDWMFLSPPVKFLILKSNPNGMVFGGGALEGDLVMRVKLSWMGLVPF